MFTSQLWLRSRTYQLDMTAHQHDSFHDRMTIDILFIAKNKLVLRVNMCFSNFERKVLDEIPIEEQEKWIFGYDDNDVEKTFTDQKFIEKVWYACVRHGYIAEDYDVMGKLLDTMRIVLINLRYVLTTITKGTLVFKNILFKNFYNNNIHVCKHFLGIK